jgi:hypothetical protein
VQEDIMSNDLPLSVTGPTVHSIDTLANLRAANTNTFPDLFVVVLDGYGAGDADAIGRSHSVSGRRDRLLDP